MIYIPTGRGRVLGPTTRPLTVLEVASAGALDSAIIARLLQFDLWIFKCSMVYLIPLQ